MATQGRASTTTVLFTDLVGSTEILQRLGDVEADALRRDHFRLLRQSIAAHGGHEVKNIGDSLMVVFNSAFDAVATAVAVQQAVHQHNEGQGEARKLHVRIGLNAGEPVRDEEDYFGTPVVIARRLCDGAKGGQIVVSALARGLVGSRGGFAFRDLGQLVLKGLAEPLAACEVLWEPLPDEQPYPAPIVEEQPGPLPRRPLPAPRRNASVAREAGTETLRRPGITGQARFTGRRAECEALDGWLAEVAAGYPRLVLLSGEAGIGKSRLLREWRASFGARASSVHGRCNEDISISYLPFIEILNSCIEQWPGCLPGLDDDDRALVQRLRGKGRGGWSGGPWEANGEQELGRLAGAVARVLLAASPQQPLVLTLDDLHWTDHPSLDLLAQVAFALADHSLRQSAAILILATYRPGEADPRVARTIVRLKREDICRELELGGLTEEETADLIQGLGFGRPSHQIVATLFEATRGNPLFVREAMQHLAASGALAERGGYMTTSHPAAELKLPGEVTAAIEARFEHLSETCRSLLGLAACMGDAISYDVLRRAFGLNEETFLAAIDECIEAQWLVSEDSQMRFSHPLVRSVTYRSLIAPRRQRMHYGIARALLEKYGDAADEHSQEIAHHLVNSGPLAPAEEIELYAKRAADRAAGLLAWGDAARYYEAAIRAAEGGAPLPAADMAELHYLAGRAYDWDEDVGPALHHLDLAVSGFRAASDAAGVVKSLTQKVRIGTTMAAMPIGTLVPEVKPLVAELERLADEDSELRARALEAIATALFHARRPVEAESVAREAIEMCQRMGDPGLESEVGNPLALAQQQSLRLSEALNTLERNLELAAVAQNRLAVCWASTRRALTQIALGRLKEGEEAASEAWQLARRQNNWSEQSLALAYCAAAAFHTGDLTAVQDYTSESIVAARRSHYPWGPLIALPTLANRRCLAGEFHEAEDAVKILDEPGELFEDPGIAVRGSAVIYRALIRAASGDLEGARQTAGPVLGLARQVMQRDLQAVPAYCCLGELAGYLGDEELMAWSLDALLEAHGMGVRLCSSWGYLLPRSIGALYAGLGRWNDSERYLEEAIAFGEAVGARTELGRACLDYADMLARRGGRNDRQGAVQMLEQASPIFAELQMKPFVERAAVLASSLGAAGTAVTGRDSSGYPDNLSPREVEVLLLLARGYSNNRIAEGLVLSIKTVARHISNIFDKIKVDNRSAATAYAFEKGLVTPSKS